MRRAVERGHGCLVSTAAHPDAYRSHAVSGHRGVVPTTTAHRQARRYRCTGRSRSATAVCGRTAGQLRPGGRRARRSARRWRSARPGRARAPAARRTPRAPRARRARRAGDGVPARLVAGRPQVQPGLGVRRSGSPLPRSAPRTTVAPRAVPLALLARRARRRRARPAAPPAPARAPSSRRACAPRAAGADERRVAGRERRPVAGEVGLLATASRPRAGPACEPPQTRGSRMLGTSSHVPAELGVALVAGDDRPDRAGPGDDLRQVLDAEHRGRSGCDGEFTQTRPHPRGRGPDLGGAVGRQRASPRPAGPRRRRSGRRSRGGRRRRPGPSPSRVGSHATSSLEPIVGSTPSGSTSGTPRRRANQPATASRSAGVP